MSTVAEDHVCEATSLVDARVALEEVNRSAGQSRWCSQRREECERRIVSARRLFERNRTLGKIEFDRAVLMVTGSVSRELGESRTACGAACEQTAGNRGDDRGGSRAPRSEPAPSRH